MTEGLTLFAGPDEARWTSVDLETRAPHRTHSLNGSDALALNVSPTGARLFGPDAREIAAWQDFDEYLRTAPAATWLR